MEQTTAEYPLTILKEFVFNDNRYTIDIFWENGKPYFKAKDVGDIIGIQKIRNKIGKYNSDEKVARIWGTLGGNQEILFLTEKGVYKLLFHSNTPIALAFQDWVTKVLKEIEQKGKYELLNLKKEKEELLQQIEKYEFAEEEFKKKEEASERHVHTSLTNTFRNTELVYMAKVKKIEDNILVKLGSSYDIVSRYSSLTKKFGTDLRFFFMVPCHRYRIFEQDLRDSVFFKPYSYDESFNEKGEKSIEIYLMSQKEIDNAIAHIKQVAHHYHGESFKRKFDDLEKDTDNLKHLCFDLAQRVTKVEEDSNDESIMTVQQTNIYEELFKTQPKIDDYAKCKGPKVQKYSNDGQKLIKTYPSYIAAARDCQNDNATEGSIKRATKNNTIYKRFRWAELDRNYPDDKVQHLPQTVESQQINNGLIAMLDINDGHIIQVFANQKEASSNRKLATGAAINKAIKQGTQSRGHYWKYWVECTKEDQDKYLSTNVLPEKYTSLRANRIKTIDKYGNIFVYSSMDAAKKEQKVSIATIKKAINQKSILKDRIWEYE